VQLRRGEARQRRRQAITGGRAAREPGRACCHLPLSVQICGVPTFPYYVNVKGTFQPFLDQHSCLHCFSISENRILCCSIIYFQKTEIMRCNFLVIRNLPHFNPSLTGMTYTVVQQKKKSKKGNQFLGN
jgi:hypothetical protein